MWSEGRILRAVEALYGREAVIVEQVANGTGWRTRRHLDALAVGCWPSRGLYLHGIEIKCSRGDYTRELNDPLKADEIGRYCDRFAIAAPAGVVVPDTLPPAWGLIEVSDDDSAKWVVRGESIPAQEVDRSFLFAVIRAATEQKSDRAQVASEIARAEKKGYDEGAASWKREYEQEVERGNATNNALTGLRQAVRGADPHLIGELRKVANSLSGRVGDLNAIRVHARSIVEQADALQKCAVALGLDVPGLSMPPSPGGG